jgi:prepilin-type N-terminal cleavage/methylation domain-containing protein
MQPTDGKSSFRRHSGYTLIEILFAVFIVATVLLGLSGMMATVLRANSTNDFTDTAINLAQDKLEELKASFLNGAALIDANAGNNANLDSTTDFDYRQTNIDGLGRPGGIFTRVWNIADSSPAAGMKTVVVIVSWTDPMGPHAVVLRTIL